MSDPHTSPCESPARAIDWVSYWQASIEEDKTSLARNLHDNVGGLLVAAVMDLAWAEKHLERAAPALREKLLRARLAIGSAIDMKRRMIEEIRPTLLDNVGLFAALSWYLREMCHDTGLHCCEDYMEPAPRFNPAAAIILFRVAQHSLSLIIRHEAIKSTTLSVFGQHSSIVMRITHDAPTTLDGATDEHHVHTLALMRNHVGSLGGELHLEVLPVGREALSACIPVSRALASAR